MRVPYNRWRHMKCLVGFAGFAWSFALVLLAVPVAAAADVDSAGTRCVGLDCGTSASPEYVPEAHGPIPAVAGIDQLRARGESGFYSIPALIFKEPFSHAPSSISQRPVSSGGCLRVSGISRL